MTNKNKSKKQPVKVQIQPVKANKPKKQPKAKNTVSTIGNVLRAGGETLGGMFGVPKLGKAVGAGLSRVFGQGDYEVKSNSLMNAEIPTFGEYMAPIRIKFRELLTVVRTQTAFGVQYSLPLNPGMMSPILANISRSFTFYKFHGLLFAYRPFTYNSVGSTNSASGMIGMVVNYDPTAPVFTDRIRAEQYTGSQAAQPNNHMLLPVECKDDSTLFNRRFVRSTAAPTAGKTLAETDYGTFQLFASGAQAAFESGELWVTYDIELFNPSPSTTGFSVAPDSYYVGNYNAPASVPNTLPPIGPAYDQAVLTKRFAQFTQIDASGIKFYAPGNYKIEIWGNTPATGTANSASFNLTDTLTNGMTDSWSSWFPNVGSSPYTFVPSSAAVSVRFAFTKFVSVPSIVDISKLPTYSFVINSSDATMKIVYVLFITRLSVEPTFTYPALTLVQAKEDKLTALEAELRELKGLLFNKKILEVEDAPEERKSGDMEEIQLTKSPSKSAQSHLKGTFVEEDVQSNRDFQSSAGQVEPGRLMREKGQRFVVQSSKSGKKQQKDTEPSFDQLE